MLTCQRVRYRRVARADAAAAAAAAAAATDAAASATTALRSGSGAARAAGVLDILCNILTPARAGASVRSYICICVYTHTQALRLQTARAADAGPGHESRRMLTYADVCCAADAVPGDESSAPNARTPEPGICVTIIVSTCN